VSAPEAAYPTEFKGVVYAVNEHADAVQSLPAYHSIRDVPAQVELAIVVVPAERVVGVARECAEASVRALLVITAGFAETGAEGARRQQELVSVCRAAGIRIVGPNCLDVINTACSIRLNATFAPHAATPGKVGFMSQSVALGIAIIRSRTARRRGPVVVRVGRQQGRHLDARLRVETAPPTRPTSSLRA
jgi:acyl-CoA synthetase (NDP forming)